MVIKQFVQFLVPATKHVRQYSNINIKTIIIINTNIELEMDTCIHIHGNPDMRYHYLVLILGNNITDQCQRQKKT